MLCRQPAERWAPTSNMACRRSAYHECTLRAPVPDGLPKAKGTRSVQSSGTGECRKKRWIPMLKPGKRPIIRHVGDCDAVRPIIASERLAIGHMERTCLGTYPVSVRRPSMLLPESLLLPSTTCHSYLLLWGSECLRPRGNRLPRIFQVLSPSKPNPCGEPSTHERSRSTHPPHQSGSR